MMRLGYKIWLQASPVNLAPEGGPGQESEANDSVREPIEYGLPY
jgi:hypothetical protein